MRPLVPLVALSLALGACRPSSTPEAPTTAPAEASPKDKRDGTARTPSADRAPTMLPPVRAERGGGAGPSAGAERQNPDTWTPGDGLDPAPAQPLPEADAKDKTEPMPSERTPMTDGARASLDAALARYFDVTATNDVGAIVALYAPRVRYYGRGTVDRGAVRQDKQQYVDRWPERTFTPDDRIQVRYVDGQTDAVVRVTYDYVVRGPGRTRSGRAWTELTYTPSPAGWRIVRERGGTL